MATEHPVGGSPPVAGSTVSEARSIRRAIALPLNDGDLGGAAASALVSAGQTARAAHAVTAGTAGAQEGAGLGTVTGGRFHGTRTASGAAAAADGSARSGRVLRPRFRPAGAAPERGTAAPVPPVGPPVATGEEGEAVLGGALAEAAAHRRPGRTAAGHSGRLGRWPMVAAAFAGAVLVSTPFVHNSGTKNVTGMESTGKATADGYASDMPTYEPNDGPASPLVPEPESDTPPVVTGSGKDFVAAGGDTVVDDGTGTTPHTLKSQPPAKTDGKPAKSAGAPADGEERTGKDQRQPADPQKGVPLSLGVSAGLPGGDSSTDSATAALQPRVGEPLKARTDAVEPVKATTNAVKADTVKSAVAKPATVKSTRTSTTKSTTTKSTGTKQTEAADKPEAKPVKAAAPVTHDWSTKVVNSTYVLDAGDSVASNRMRITLRSNGNLVISDENGVVRWSSGTSGAGNHAVFQADGNFVVYSSDNRTLWSSGTAGNDGAKLVIQADGNVAILSAGDATLWAAGTQH